MSDYTLYPSLEAEVQIPENGILSRTLVQRRSVKVVIFGFAPGQELSAHTAPMAASLYFVQGEATVTLGEEVREVKAGAFVHMAPALAARHCRTHACGDAVDDAQTGEGRAGGFLGAASGKAVKKTHRRGETPINASIPRPLSDAGLQG